MRTLSFRGFKALVTAQFLLALNDNLFKMIVSLMLVGVFFESGQATSYLCLTQIFFALPYVLFSAYGGAFADRYDKAFILKAMKGAEIAVMSLGLLLFAARGSLPESVWASSLLAVVFLMGAQSAVFSPSKYGILPEMLSPEELSRGNGYLECGTFLAIIAGTVLGAVVLGLGEGHPYVPGLVVVSIASVGFMASIFIPRTKAKPEKVSIPLNPFSDIWRGIRAIYQDTALFYVFLGICFFWFVGGFLQINIFLYLREYLSGDTYENAAAVFMTGLAIGVGSGSVFAGYASNGKVEIGLVPIGATLLAVSSVCLGLLPFNYVLSLSLCTFMGLAAGMYIVPLNAYLQANSPEEERGRYVAAGNAASMCGVIFAACVIWLLQDLLGISARQVFLMLGGTAVLATIMALIKLPQALVRCINWLVTHCVYRLKVVGVDNVPKKGGALIVCNHVTWVDASILLASLGRPIRFVMYRPIYEGRIVGFFARIMGAIPIDSEGNPKELMRSLKEARKAIQAGEIVCIFAEGMLTRLGRMLTFQKGVEVIMKGVDAPIIPAYLDQLWGSVFSYRGGKFFWKLPRSLPYDVTLAYGKSLSSGTGVAEVRSAVQGLSSEIFPYRRQANKLLHSGFIQAAKSNLFRPCMTDSSGKTLNYLQALGLVLVLSRKVSKDLNPQEMIGLILPTTCIGALTNVAVMLSGCVPVNINYSASGESQTGAMRQCRMRRIISSRTFFEKLDINLQDYPEDVEIVFVEDLFAEIGKVDRGIAFLLALLCPRVILEHLFSKGQGTSQSLATVIFSSGSTGDPKGVMLSHANVFSNLDSIADIFYLERSDSVLGVLPFFHSFGFTITLWLPLVSGIKACFHPNPLDVNEIGELARRERPTLLFATPTFLTLYLRRVKAEQFKSLRLVVVGAEKLKDKLAKAFEKKFGVTPLEGYGATELSPVATMNLPDYVCEDLGIQKGMKPGSVGHPIPRVSVKVVDPDSLEELPVDTEGLLLVSGPNVMLGYLDRSDLTESVMLGKWYNTGDIARIDGDGFITITDRLSRFSKIGGEMIPHVKLEEEILGVLSEKESEVAVTAISDEKKGEKLVVLFTRDLDADKIVKALNNRGLPNLWIPKKECFLKVDALPLLGSGKLDLRAMKAMAEELSSFG